MQKINYQRPWMADYQTRGLFNDKRYGLVEGSTKCGKTAPCLVWLFEQAALGGAHNRNYWWVAPVYSQAEIAYKRFCQGIPKTMFKAHNTKLIVELVNGAMIWFKSGDNPDNLYGEDVYAAVCDEASRLGADSFYALRSTLTATRGKMRIIGNVKGRKNWFYKMCRTAERGHPEMSYARITCEDAVKAGILSQKEIDDARDTLPAHVFEELYMAVATGGDGRVYRDFGPENIRSDIGDKGGTILVGMDFNVNPMSCAIGQKHVNQFHQFDEITIKNSNTVQMAQEIKRRYPNREIIVYPDPAGNARKTSAAVGQTDFSILREHGFVVLARTKHPLIVDRVNCVNALVKNANGERNYFVHPRCKATIECMEDLMYKEDTSVPDKSQGIEHIGDGVGYLIEYEFPIVSDRVGFAQILGL